jgi:hypothetical protein
MGHISQYFRRAKQALQQHFATAQVKSRKVTPRHFSKNTRRKQGAAKQIRSRGPFNLSPQAGFALSSVGTILSNRIAAACRVEIAVSNPNFTVAMGIYSSNSSHRLKSRVEPTPVHADS